MILVTRGLGSTNLVTVGLGAQLGETFTESIVGQLMMSGAVLTTYMAGEAGDNRAPRGNFFGTFFNNRRY